MLYSHLSFRDLVANLNHDSCSNVDQSFVITSKRLLTATRPMSYIMYLLHVHCKSRSVTSLSCIYGGAKRAIACVI
jgi:hypothetical protein